MVAIAHVAVVPTLVAEQFHPQVELFAVGDDNAAVARRHVLRLLKTETADVAERADVTPFVFGRVGLSAVFDQNHIVSFGDLSDPVHLARTPEQVNEDNRPRAFRDTRLDGLRCHVQCDRIDIRENGHCRLLQDRHDAAGVGDWRGDDLVAGIGVHRADG